MACKNGLYRQSYSICRIEYQIQIFSFQEDDKWLNSLLGPHFEHAVALKFSLCPSVNNFCKHQIPKSITVRNLKFCTIFCF